MSRLVAVVFSLVFALPALGQTTVGNGGDTVLCAAAEGSPFAGLYALDYLVLSSTLGTTALVPATSWEASRERITALLAAKHPDLAASFTQFAAQLFNTTDYVVKRRWIPSDLPLTDIHDENLLQILSRNCTTVGGGHLWQTVIRTQRNAQVTYYYRPDLMDRLLAEAPLQYSMLLVHEWLWELTDNAEVSRQVNYFLHSTSADAATPTGFQIAVANLGVDLAERAVRFGDFCQRPTRLRHALLRGLREYAPGSCDEVTRPFFERLGERVPGSFGAVTIDLSGRDPELGELPELELTPGDFAGISSGPGVAWRLDLSDNAMTHLSRHQFRDFFNLINLDLSGNALRSLHSGTFATLSQLQTLDVSKNALTALSFDLNRNPLLTTLRASDNRLTTIPVSVNAVALETLDLARNAITAVDENMLYPYASSISRLDLSDNALHEMPAALGARIHAVGYLDLSRNPLGAIPEALLMTVQTSDLCALTRLPDENGDMTTYPGCFAQLNAIGATDAGSADLWRAAAIYALGLAGNQVAAISEPVATAWGQNRYLRKLDLSNNALTSFAAPINARGSLTTLNLSGNRLVDVPGGVFSLLDGQDEECVLNVSGNPLSSEAHAGVLAWCATGVCACSL